MHPLSVEEIMAGIKEKAAAKRKEHKENQVASQLTSHSGVFPHGVHSRQRIKPLSLSLNFSSPSLPVSNAYKLKDFLHYHDQDFVQIAYTHILGRQPDVEGFEHYLGLLRHAQLTKVEILARLRFSPEGRKKKVRIRGLSWPLGAQLISRVPVIGYLWQFMSGLVRLPKIMYTIFRLETELWHELSKQRKKLAETSNTITEKVNEIVALYNRSNEIHQKAFQEVHDILQEKADSSDLNALNRKIIDYGPPDLQPTYEQEPELLVQKGVRELPDDVSEHPPSVSDDLYYLIFENAFYRHEVVKEKQKVYLPYIQSLENTESRKWLDIGCGRGEFLNILVTANIDPVGVEINQFESDSLLDVGFNVHNIDGNSFLRNSEEKYLGMSAFQVIEHLDPQYLDEMLALAYSRIMPGGLIILETINPKCDTGLANFFLDETHKRPVPPELLCFKLEWMGFTPKKLLYSGLVPEELRTREVTRNYQDYAIIAYRN